MIVQQITDYVTAVLLGLYSSSDWKLRFNILSTRFYLIDGQTIIHGTVTGCRRATPIDPPGFARKSLPPIAEPESFVTPLAMKNLN